MTCWSARPMPVAVVPTVTWPKSSEESSNGGVLPDAVSPVPLIVDWRPTSEALRALDAASTR